MTITASVVKILFLVSVLWVRMLAGVSATEISNYAVNTIVLPPPAGLLPSHLRSLPGSRHCLRTGHHSMLRIQNSNSYQSNNLSNTVIGT